MARKSMKQFIQEHKADIEGRSMREELFRELAEAEAKAIESMARYKFAMFGYWAGIWVHLNRITRSNLPNPFQALVKLAREIRNGDAPCSVATEQKVRCPECGLPRPGDRAN